MKSAGSDSRGEAGRRGRRGEGVPGKPGRLDDLMVFDDKAAQSAVQLPRLPAMPPARRGDVRSPP